MTATTRDKIVAAATRLFAARGFAAVSTKDIARAARVNEATLFRNYGDKRRIFNAVIRAQIDQLLPIETFEQIASEPDCVVATRKFVAALEHLFSADYLRITWASALELGASNAIVKAMVPRYRIVLRRIAREQRNGKLIKMPTKLQLRSLVFMIYAHCAIATMFSEEYPRMMGATGSSVVEYVEVWLYGVASDHLRASK